MMSNADASKAKQKLAQFNAALRSFTITDERVKWMFPETKELNNKISLPTYNNCLRTETALHLTFIKPSYNAFESLLKQGADFLITDENNSTIAHLAITSESKNFYINRILSMQMESGIVENFCNNEGVTHFHAACSANNVKAVEFYLSNGVSIDHTVNNDSAHFAGYSPLHFASKYCSLEVTEVLFKRGANVHIKDKNGMTPLHIVIKRSLQAISENETTKLAWDKIKILFITYVFNDRTTDDLGLSCCHIACTITNYSLAQSLLKNFININDAVSTESYLYPGYTPLHFAVYFNFEIVQLLVSKGADLQAKDANGDTPLDLCIRKYKKEAVCVILLMKKEWKNILFTDKKTKLADFFTSIRDGELPEFLQRLSDSFNIKIPKDSPLWPGYSLIHMLAILYKSSLKFSYNSKTDEYQLFMFDVWSTMKNLCCNLCDHVDEENLSLLHKACAQDDESLVEKLLLGFNNVNLAYKGKAIEDFIEPSWTPLHVAVAKGSFRVIVPLLQHGADIYKTDAKGRTPIHLIAIHLSAYPRESRKIGNILLSTNCLNDVIVPDTGLSHLYVACYCGQLEAVKKLLNKDNVNVKPFSKYTPLNGALMSDGNVEIIELLIQAGADLFAKNNSGIPILYDELDLPVYRNYRNYFVSLLKRNENLYKRVKMETGLTKLHLACVTVNTKYIKQLLADGAKVNAKIKIDSPIWPGYTPLHILLLCPFEYNKRHDMVQLLLNKGAEVTLFNVEETPLLMAYRIYISYYWYSTGVKEINYNLKRVKMLLNAQKDFSVNPSTRDGLTHFHVACHMGNTFVIEKYLKRDVTELNQPIDFFFQNEYKVVRFAGYTPLHLAVECKEDSMNNKLQIVDMLLKHGAYVDAQNSCGNTPLHLADNLDVAERLIRGGADLSIVNACNHNPLESLLSENWFQINKIENLIRLGCYFNSYNVLTEYGLMAESLYRIKFNEIKQLIPVIVMNCPRSIKTDENGRTVIHNIVSREEYSNSADEYAAIIVQLSRLGYNIDAQDNLGRTALHVAVKFKNFNAISGLLLAGADINIKDVNGETAMAYSFEQCIRDEFTDNNPDQCEHYQMFKALAIHVLKLDCCDLDICKYNRIRCHIAFGKFGSGNSYYMLLASSLDDLKNMKIGGYSMSLLDFLSETNAVADYPTMPEMKRDAIDLFFRSNEMLNFREKFGEFSGIIQLQYRKAVMRIQLVEEAKDSVTMIAGFCLPDLCFDVLVRFLSNDELKNLIASTNF